MTAPPGPWQFLGTESQRHWQLLNFDLLPCVSRAHQGKLGMPMASMKPGYKMSSYNSRSWDSCTLIMETSLNMKDGAEKLEMPKKTIAHITVFG